jgi:hypothetical protein
MRRNSPTGAAAGCGAAALSTPACKAQTKAAHHEYVKTTTIQKIQLGSNSFPFAYAESFI